MKRRRDTPEQTKDNIIDATHAYLDGAMDCEKYPFLFQADDRFKDGWIPVIAQECVNSFLNRYEMLNPPVVVLAGYVAGFWSQFCDRAASEAWLRGAKHSRFILCVMELIEQKSTLKK
jgi:hypothetical protein